MLLLWWSSAECTLRTMGKPRSAATVALNCVRLHVPDPWVGNAGGRDPERAGRIDAVVRSRALRYRSGSERRLREGRR